MTASNPKKIVLNSLDTLRLIELPANTTITPGQKVEYHSSNELKLNNTEGSPGVIVAVENSAAGGEITDDYAVDDTVVAAILQSGDEFYGFLPASEAAVLIGDNLMADTAGNFSNITAAAGKVNTVRALEAVDNSSGSSAARIKLQVI